MDMSNNGVVRKSGWKYLLLSLGAFFGLASEVIHMYGWEPFVFGNISWRDYSAFQSLIHWVITCVTWIIVGFLLIRAARNKLNFDIFVKGDSMKGWQLVAALFGVALSVTMSYLDWGTFKIIGEFQSKNSIPKFLFQHLYYIVETGMFLLIIVFGQKAFEIWTKKENIPWGGIICGLTWGAAHLISRGYFDVANGVISTLNGFLFGAAYLLTNRDIRKSWVILFLMFTM
ncbi:MAG: hypothetical protein LBS19_06225 [Clostridiales bacterium]|jgi:hypothetical protein|nr:hypothetical protein [Clostridiales bacterium]